MGNKTISNEKQPSMKSDVKHITWKICTTGYQKYCVYFQSEITIVNKIICLISKLLLAWFLQYPILCTYDIYGLPLAGFQPLTTKCWYQVLYLYFFPWGSYRIFLKHYAKDQSRVFLDRVLNVWSLHHTYYKSLQY